MTTEEREAMVLILAARKRVYKVLQDLWLNEPGREQLEALYDPDLAVAMDLLTPEGEKSLKQDLAALYVSREDFNEEYFAGVRKNYYEMLIADRESVYPPFATKYLPLDNDRLIEEMLTVRATYERYGASGNKSEMEADGYLAMELSFMGRTCGLAQQAVEMGVDRRAGQLLEEQDWFLKDHLLSWVPEWIKALRASEKDDFYTKLANLTARFLVCDSIGLDDISALV